MKKTFSLFFLFSLIFGAQFISAQTGRLHDYNIVGWYNVFGTFKLNNKFSLHTEYQWRRDNVIKDWQQSLLRTGLNYQITPRVQLRAGYAWIETFPYGDIPINSMGKDFTEHRIFEMAQVNHKQSFVDLSHRFILEQRWVGRYSSAALEKEDEFVYLNRFRYMFRLQLPFVDSIRPEKYFYLALYDEIFLGFGENVTVNVFDQNRFGLLLGYRFNKILRMEAGFINQAVKFGRLIAGRRVFQHNNGIIINAIINTDLTNSKSREK